MKFHLNYKHPEQPFKISHKDKIMLIGSCFAENIGEKLSETKFNCHINPNGILFNPSSISQAIRTYLQPQLFSENLIVHSDCGGGRRRRPAPTRSPSAATRSTSASCAPGPRPAR